MSITLSQVRNDMDAYAGYLLDQKSKESALVDIKAFVIANIDASIEQSKQKIANLDQRMQQLNEAESAAQAKIDAARLKIANAQVKMDAAHAQIARGNELKAIGQAKQNFSCTTIFCHILGLPKPQENDVEKVNELVSKYFPNAEISGKKVDDKNQFALTSMKPIADYLNQNQTHAAKLKHLDFRYINDIKDVKDIVEVLNKYTNIGALVFGSQMQTAITQAFDAVCAKENRRFKLLFK